MAALTPGRRADVAAALGAAYGGVLVSDPRGVLRRLGEGWPSETEVTVVRVLGARQVVQAAAVRRWPRAAGRLGALADGLHASSMLALAVLRPRHRRAALASGAVAVVLALLELGGGE